MFKLPATTGREPSGYLMAGAGVCMCVCVRENEALLTKTTRKKLTIACPFVISFINNQQQIL